MFPTHSPALYEFLREQRLVAQARLDELNEEHKATGKPLADVVVDAGLIEKSALLERIALHFGHEYLPDMPAQFPGEAIATLTGKLARDYAVMPLRVDATSIDLLAADPFNAQIVDDLTFALGRSVRLFLADPEKIDVQIRQHYGEDDASLDELLQEISTGEFIQDESKLSAHDIETMAEQTPIIRFVNLVIGQAIRDKASDIHFEPFEHEFKIRYRIDGALYEMAPPPKQLALPITSRLKVLANLNIAERRVPQDGRIKISIGGRQVDLRVSTLPTQFGESVVLRVLDRSTVNLEIESLGMPEYIYNYLLKTIEKPNGIFIVTGPTGSGKTTTLYACLNKINTIDSKVLTAEDPVEYDIEGIIQVPMNEAIGLTFARTLRAFLRQDPDRIMVGETRDVETAQIAIQASLTGHLVFTTLHTNDAPGAVTRLIDMGVEPFMISSSLEGVLGQRLIRKICLSCRTAYEPNEATLAQLGISPHEIGDKTFYYGVGCEACNNTGYKGRKGIYELLDMSDPIRELINKRAPGVVLKQKAVELGMTTLRQDGLRSIYDGETTIEEVLKYT